MAFNFNWSPLAADADFYSRARDLLTKALNKSPKPPIIVDDILVSELNLGTVPPNLEILEIGDLAEDRFRGIFKMSYSGDAFLTLKTRVQVCNASVFFLRHIPLAASSGKPRQALCSTKLMGNIKESLLEDIQETRTTYPEFSLNEHFGGRGALDQILPLVVGSIHGGDPR